MHPKFVTLYRHIIEQERSIPKATGELSDLLADIALACKLISLEVNRAGLIDILGFTGDTNVQGEEVKKLDVYAHDTLVKLRKNFIWDNSPPLMEPMAAENPEIK